MMEILHADLQIKPFRLRDQSASFVLCRTQQDARTFLHSVLKSDRGVGLLYGPPSSGKTTVIREFTGRLPKEVAVAVVDGTRSKAPDLFRAILVEYGYATPFVSAKDSWIGLNMFIAQQALGTEAPLLVIENINKMHPSALQAICSLAEIRSLGRFSLRLILVSDKPPFKIIHAPAMKAIAARMFGAFELGPMTQLETLRYLQKKLRANDFVSPERVLPLDICVELHKASKGWPGILDRLATQAIERAATWPIRREHINRAAVSIMSESSSATRIVEQHGEPEIQKLLLTMNRKTIQEFELKKSRILIGRSELCDLVVNSRFVSKVHALIVRDKKAMLLVDLNSTNGTLVNSRRIQSKALRHDDVISLGNHGIKLIAPSYRTRRLVEERGLADTAQMKTLADMRRLKAQASAGIAQVEKRQI